ncbi:hypothetical protein C0992_001629 [Termitomyces sp. T32_za158]|nr:hypothetical protein C0992_001629 [Termitomyces sp. T32_za158]
MRSACSASGSSSGTSNGNLNGRGGSMNSPGDSMKSEIAQMTDKGHSTSHSHPFITRQLNRTASQTSSHTQGSTSSVVRPSPSSTVPPKLSGTDTSLPFLTAPFPGSHPHSHLSTSREGRRSYVGVPMPTIAGSLESGPREGDGASEVYGGEDDNESLHAESFVTASGEEVTRVHVREYRNEDGEMEEVEMDIADAEDAPYQASIDGESTHSLNPDRDNEQNHSTTSLHASSEPAFPPGAAYNNINDSSNTNAMTNSNSRSITSSFVPLRWDDVPLGTSVVTFSARPKPASIWTWLADRTPAFWAFWLGFVFPVVWFVGGWHFTNVGECPPKVGMWEFYFFGNGGYVWRRVRAVACFGRRRKAEWAVGSDVEQGKMGNWKGKEKAEVVEDEVRNGQKEQQKQGPKVPRWVTEKQSSEGRLRLQDPKRSLRGISFGYPFVPRPVSARRRTSASTALAQPERWRQRVMRIITKPHRLFDCFYGVRLREVRGRPESRRRVFDPWIQRCRYAFCYALFALCVGLCVACTLLIVFNTRQLN